MPRQPVSLIFRPVRGVERFSAAGDPLERLAAVVDFEVRGPLVAALRRSDRGKGGCPPFDPVLMFKIRKALCLLAMRWPALAT
jgi:hypothetical protein